VLTNLKRIIKNCKSDNKKTAVISNRTSAQLLRHYMHP